MVGVKKPGAESFEPQNTLRIRRGRCELRESQP